MYLLNKKTLNKTQCEKLNIVLNLLNECKQDFEVMKKSVQDKDIRAVISQLIEESVTYTNQLSSSVSPGERTRIAYFKKGKKDSKEESAKENKGSLQQFLTKEELLEECSRNEYIFEKAYRDVLNACTHQTNLTNMMNDQLNEIKWMLMKIRLKYMINNNIVYPYSLHKREVKI